MNTPASLLFLTINMIHSKCRILIIVCKYAREFLEYGKNKEGYWTRDRFVAQMQRAIEIAEIKYSKQDVHWYGVKCWYSTTAAATQLQCTNACITFLTNF